MTDRVDELLERRRAVARKRTRELLEWPKPKLFKYLLGLDAVDLWFDPRSPLVRVPDDWKDRTHVIARVTARDVEAFDSERIAAAAVEDGKKVPISVPWRFVFAMTTLAVGGRVWKSEAPTELQDELQPEPGEPCIIREIDDPNAEE